MCVVSQKFVEQMMAERGRKSRGLSQAAVSDEKWGHYIACPAMYCRNHTSFCGVDRQWCPHFSICMRRGRTVPRLFIPQKIYNEFLTHHASSLPA